MNLLDQKPDKFYDLNFQTFELKVKIATLWILFGINLTIDFTLKDYYPGGAGSTQNIATLSSQQISLLLIGDACIRLIPFILAFLSIALKDIWNRLLNLILGIVFTFFSFIGLISLSFQLTVQAAYEVVIQIVAITAPMLISWYTYSWPKQEFKQLY